MQQVWLTTLPALPSTSLLATLERPNALTCAPAVLFVDSVVLPYMECACLGTVAVSRHQGGDAHSIADVTACLCTLAGITKLGQAPSASLVTKRALHGCLKQLRNRSDVNWGMEMQPSV